MENGLQLIIAGELEDKRSFEANDKSMMYCLTIVGRGFTQDQYVEKQVFESAPEKGSPITVFGPPKVNRRGDIAIKMRECQIAASASSAEMDETSSGRRGRRAA